MISYSDPRMIVSGNNCWITAVLLCFLLLFLVGACFLLRFLVRAPSDPPPPENRRVNLSIISSPDGGGVNSIRLERSITTNGLLSVIQILLPYTSSLPFRVNLQVQNYNSPPGGTGHVRYAFLAELPLLNTLILAPIPSLYSWSFELGTTTFTFTLPTTTGFFGLQIVGYLPPFAPAIMPALTLGSGIVAAGFVLHNGDFVILTSLMQQIGSSAIFFAFFRIVGLMLGENMIFIPWLSFLLIIAVLVMLTVRNFHGGDAVELEGEERTLNQEEQGGAFIHQDFLNGGDAPDA